MPTQQRRPPAVTHVCTPTLESPALRTERCVFDRFNVLCLIRVCLLLSEGSGAGAGGTAADNGVPVSLCVPYPGAVDVSVDQPRHMLIATGLSGYCHVR